MFDKDEALENLDKYKSLAYRKAKLIEDDRNKSFKPFNDILTRYYYIKRLPVTHYFGKETEEKFPKLRSCFGDEKIAFYNDDYIITYDDIQFQEPHSKVMSISKVAKFKTLFTSNVKLEIVKHIYTTDSVYDKTFDFVQMYNDMKEVVKASLEKEVYNLDKKVAEATLYKFE